MSIRNEEKRKLYLKAQGNCLKLVRSLLEVFLEEKPFTRYVYYVEELRDGRKIFIRRPTRRFNFDFEIWVESPQRTYMPSHDDIINDLIMKKKENPDTFKKLMRLINKVYNCFDPEDVLEEVDFEFKVGESIEFIFKVLKWMFILEDIYYWNYSRRAKLMEEIKKQITTSKINNFI